MAFQRGLFLAYGAIEKIGQALRREHTVEECQQIFLALQCVHRLFY